MLQIYNLDPYCYFDLLFPGKYDGVANDVPYMFPQLKGFPSIFFLSAYEKYDPILYQGERNYKDLKEWINRHSSIFLTEEERTGQIAEVDEEIESFTSENINTDKKPEEATSEEGSKKDELWTNTLPKSVKTTIFLENWT